MATENKNIKEVGKLYTETLYYETKLTEKYFKKFVLQLLEQLSSPVSSDELLVMDIVSDNKTICQRDLAKILFKDRANTGRLIESLEKKEFVVREKDTRANRTINKVTLTKKGIEVLERLKSKITPIFNDIFSKFTEEEIAGVSKVMKKMRDSFDLNIRI